MSVTCVALGEGLPVDVPQVHPPGEHAGCHSAVGKNGELGTSAHSAQLLKTRRLPVASTAERADTVCTNVSDPELQQLILCLQSTLPVQHVDDAAAHLDSEFARTPYVGSGVRM